MRILNLTILSTLLLGAATARAGIIDIQFDSPTLSGQSDAMLTFTAVLTNTTGFDVFLNVDSVILASFPLSAIDDSPFFANTPAVLPASTSTGSVAILTITIPDSTAVGFYGGTFQILGGGTAEDQTLVGSADFTVNVAPEPASWELAFTAVALGWFLARRRVRLRGRNS